MVLWAFSGSGGQGPRVREPAMKPAGKPDARNGHVRFDERGWETGRPLASVPAPILDSTRGVAQASAQCRLLLVSAPSGAGPSACQVTEPTRGRRKRLPHMKAKVSGIALVGTG